MRFENLEPPKDDKKFILVSRAVSSLNKLIKISLPFFQTGSVALFHKGEKWKEEISEANKFWSFEFKAIKSLTNKESRILLLKNVFIKNNE